MPDQSILPFGASQDQVKKCSKCGAVKSRQEFHGAKRERDGLRSICKDCRQSSYQANREAVSQSMRAHYRRNAETIKSRVRAYRTASPEKVKETGRNYHQRNRDKRLASLKRWQDQNRDKRRAADAAYRESHREEKREYERRYRSANPAWDKSKKHTRRAAKANGGRFTSDEWQALCASYDFTCLCCGKQEPEITLTPDHVVPLARGGGNTIENIQPLCSVCNSRKGAKVIDYRPGWIQKSATCSRIG